MSVFDLIALVWPLHTEWASQSGCPITKEGNKPSVRAFGGCPGALQALCLMEPINERFAPAEGYTTHEALKAIFRHYADLGRKPRDGVARGVDRTQWAKLVSESPDLPARLATADADLVFAKVAARGARRLDYNASSRRSRRRACGSTPLWTPARPSPRCAPSTSSASSPSSPTRAARCSASSTTSSGPRRRRCRDHLLGRLRGRRRPRPHRLSKIANPRTKEATPKIPYPPRPTAPPPPKIARTTRRRPPRRRRPRPARARGSRASGRRPRRRRAARGPRRGSGP